MECLPLKLKNVPSAISLERKLTKDVINDYETIFEIFFSF